MSKASNARTTLQNRMGRLEALALDRYANGLRVASFHREWIGLKRALKTVLHYQSLVRFLGEEHPEVMDNWSGYVNDVGEFSLPEWPLEEKS